VTDTDVEYEPVPSPLSDAQKVRAEALRVARAVLVNRGFASSGKLDPLDLIPVAIYIETGQDPYETKTDEIQTSNAPRYRMWPIA
jgi:hypothetical protein